GKWLAAGAPSGFSLYKTDTWEMTRHVETPATWLAFSPDGCSIFSAAHENPDQRLHSVSRWESESGKLLKSEPLASRGHWAVFHLTLDGKMLYSMACDPAEPAFHAYDALSLHERPVSELNSGK